MAMLMKKTFRVDLRQNARDFVGVSLNDIPVLDRGNMNDSRLRRDFGRLLGQAERQGEMVAFYVVDDNGNCPHSIECEPATPRDIQKTRSLTADRNLLNQKLAKIKENPKLKGFCGHFQELSHLPQENQSAHFWKWRTHQGDPWKLVWFWGFAPRDQEPCSPAICSKTECECLFLRRGGSNLCPVCSGEGQKTKIVQNGVGVPPGNAITTTNRRSWKWIAALLLLLLIGSLLYLLLYPKKPDEPTIAVVNSENIVAPEPTPAINDIPNPSTEDPSGTEDSQEGEEADEGALRQMAPFEESSSKEGDSESPGTDADPSGGTGDPTGEAGDPSGGGSDPSSGSGDSARGGDDPSGGGGDSPGGGSSSSGNGRPSGGGAPSGGVGPSGSGGDPSAVGGRSAGSDPAVNAKSPGGAGKPSPGAKGPYKNVNPTKTEEEPSKPQKAKEGFRIKKIQRGDDSKNFSLVLSGSVSDPKNYEYRIAATEGRQAQPWVQAKTQDGKSVLDLASPQLTMMKEDSTYTVYIERRNRSTNKVERAPFKFKLGMTAEPVKQD